MCNTVVKSLLVESVDLKNKTNRLYLVFNYNFNINGILVHTTSPIPLICTVEVVL